MNPLNALLWLFPFAFASAYGSAWKSTNDELWDAMRQEPPLRRVGLLLRVFWDVLCHAPQEHVRALKASLLGPVPQMMAARAGAWPTLLAWGRHIRPDLPGCQRGLFSLLGGVWVFAVLYIWVMSRAHEYTATALRGVYAEYDSHAPTQVFLGMGSWFSIVLAVIAAIAISVSWQYIKHRRGPLLGNVLAAVFGFYLSLHLLLLATLPSVADEATATFVRYPKSQQFLAPRPWTEDLSEWTPEQHIWFDAKTLTIKEDKKAVWCAARAAWNESEYQELYDIRGQDSAIRALLWAAQSATLVGDGCYTTQEQVAKQNRLALRLRATTNTTQMTWLQLSRISWVHDQLAAAHYILWPRLLPDVLKVCVSIESELFSMGVLTREDIARAQSDNMCLNLQQGPLGQGPEALGSPVGPIPSDQLPPRWMWGPKSTIMIDAGARARVLGPADIEVVRAAVMEYQGLDQGRASSP